MSVQCDKCAGRGIIVRHNVATPCPCMQQRALLSKIKYSQIPPKLAQCNFDSFRLGYYSKHQLDSSRNISHREIAERTLNAAREFVTNYLKHGHSEGLFLTGPVGSGKTFLACCIANTLLAQSKTLLFIVVPDLLNQIKATYDNVGQKEITESELLDTAREVPLLILDDLGAHNYTDWTRNKVFSIINYRLNYLLPTIITSNIKLEDLEEHLGERTTSRILEMCRPYRLLVDVDIRMQRAGVKPLSSQ